MKSGDLERLIPIEVALTTRDLYLIVSSEGNGSHDWSNWIEPEVVLKDGTTVDLATLPWRTAFSTVGPIQRGKTYRGGTMNVAGKEYTVGLGTHADSFIWFQVPEGATTFRAKVALDDGGAVRGDDLTPASVRFLVVDREPIGFAKTHDHSLHAVVAGPDGKWHFNQGNCRAHFKSKDGDEFLIGGPYSGGEEPMADSQAIAGKQSSDGKVWVGGFAAKMNPDGSLVRIIGHGFRNSYEHTVTSFGDVFQNDNDDPHACRTTWLMEGGFLGFFSPDGKRGWQADQRPGQSIQDAQWRQWVNTRTSARKGNRWIAYSDDSGETWRDCHQDDELFDGPPDMYGCKAGLLRLDRDDCDILLFSSPDPSLPEKQNRANVNVWASFDGGKTWPVNRLIKEGPGNYSWITQGRKGTPSEGFIYVRSIEGGMARFNMAWLLQPDDKKAGKYAFAKDAPIGKNLGSITISLLDPDGKLIKTSKPITGGFKVRETVQWPDGFKLDKYLATSVTFKFELEGEAELYAIRFDELFWE